MVTSQDKRRVVRSGRRCGAGVSRASATFTLDWNDENTKAAVITTMTFCQSALVRTRFYQGLLSSLESCEMEQVVCLGIGNLSTSPRSPSMWQLACALALREHMKELVISFYDPCTTLSEAQMMEKEWNIQVLCTDTKGRQTVNGQTTLFFMPHCPLHLYSNVLWTNWYNLDRVVIFGNSLLLYKERAMEKKKVPETLSLLLPFVKQVQINVTKSDVESVVGNLEHAFNDCYVTVFVINNDTELPPRPEAPLQDEDAEVI